MTTNVRRREGVAPALGRRRLLSLVEGLTVFALGAVVMHLLYAGTITTPGAEIGVPGHDSFYHIAMASILPEHGAMKSFPWLEYVYFRDQGDAFVSHHWGFHLLLLPFVQAAEWLRGDALAGGRWAITAVFGANLLLFHLLLRQRRVPLHWLWLALFFLLPDQFFARHGFVRAIGPSLLFMQLILLALFARRYWLAGLAVGAYVHLYLGAVMFGPILVMTYAAAQVVARRADRVIPVKMTLITAAAWGLGVVTYPYAGGMFEFLRLQVFGSGLSPDIEVGREWRPYTDAWFILTMSAPLLIAWAAALFLRLRMGPRMRAEDAALFVLQLAFLVLTFKARRFIEYWPPMCLLSAAYLAADPLAEMAASLRAWLGARAVATQRRLAAGGVLFLIAGTGGACAWLLAGGTETALAGSWQIWVAVAVLAAVTLARRWTLAPGPLAPRARDGAFAALGAVTIALLAALTPAATLAMGGAGLASATRQLECYYDLDEVRSMMAFIESHSSPGDIIFTDDWDVFPLFFYFNRHNHYIVGLDPKFTHQREPDLWNRFVKISRGQVPSTIRLAGATDETERAPVALEDIREHFHASYVIADDDHRALADALVGAPRFAELVYPSPSYTEAEGSPYVVFRIRDAGERPSETLAAGGNAAGPLFLGDLSPRSISQGWGQLGANRTVEGNTIRLGGRTYARGVGTHAPSSIVYDLPEGYAWFEAHVGVDDETDGRGSVVASVSLDGETVFESPTLEGGGPPASVRVPIDGAGRLQLAASPTADGRRHDHVSWAGARLMPRE